MGHNDNMYKNDYYSDQSFQVSRDTDDETYSWRKRRQN